MINGILLNFTGKRIPKKKRIYWQRWISFGINSLMLKFRVLKTAKENKMSMNAEIIDTIEKEAKEHIATLIQYLRDGEDIKNDLGRALAHLAKMGEFVSGYKKE